MVWLFDWERENLLESTHTAGKVLINSLVIFIIKAAIGRSSFSCLRNYVVCPSSMVCPHLFKTTAGGACSISPHGSVSAAKEVDEKAVKNKKTLALPCFEAQYTPIFSISPVKVPSWHVFQK